MPSLGRGQTSDCTNPVLDIHTAVGNPAVATDVAVLEFRIFDISTPTKRATPVQVFPVLAGTYQALDPTLDCPAGVRLSVGRYAAVYTVDAAEPLGDHLIEWRFRQSVVHPLETFCEEFYVTPSLVINPDDNVYCSVAEIRAEGYSELMLDGFTAQQFDDRITTLIRIASRYVEKVTGRWFYALQFDEDNRFVLDGKGGWITTPFNVRSGARTLHLEIPIIRLDKMFIRSDGTFNPSLTEINLSGQLVQVYNRHISGNVHPDDRENPRIAFTQVRAVETVASGLYPAPHVFPEGRLNVHLEGVFGYTDPDGSAFGRTPDLIRQVTCRLVARDIRLDSDECEKFASNNKFRILKDKEGTTDIRLQELWLKGAFTGDPRIDNVLMSYKRPPRIAVV